MAEFVYNNAKLRYANDTVGLTTQGGSTGTPHFILLVTTGYLDVANRVDQDFLLFATTSQSVVHFEVSSSSMGSSGRVAIGQSTATEDDTLELAYVSASTAVTYTSVSSGAGAIGGAVIFAQIAASDSSGRIPIAMYETGFPVTPNGGDITLNFSTGGWVQFASTS